MEVINSKFLVVIKSNNFVISSNQLCIISSTGGLISSNGSADFIYKIGFSDYTINITNFFNYIFNNTRVVNAHNITVIINHKIISTTNYIGINGFKIISNRSSSKRHIFNNSFRIKIIKISMIEILYNIFSKFITNITLRTNKTCSLFEYFSNIIFFRNSRIHNITIMNYNSMKLIIFCNITIRIFIKNVNIILTIYIFKIIITNTISYFSRHTSSNIFITILCNKTNSTGKSRIYNNRRNIF